MHPRRTGKGKINEGSDYRRLSPNNRTPRAKQNTQIYSTLVLVAEHKRRRRGFLQLLRKMPSHQSLTSKITGMGTHNANPFKTLGKYWDGFHWTFRRGRRIRLYPPGNLPNDRNGPPHPYPLMRSDRTQPLNQPLNLEVQGHPLS